MLLVWYSMVMKRKIGMELYGPCSETGAMPLMHDMIGTIDVDGRIAFHHIQEVELSKGSQWYVRTKEDIVLPSSDVYLLYTSNSISNIKDTVRKLKTKINNSY